MLTLAEGSNRGPSQSFDRSQFILTFLTIGDSKRIGRQALAEKAGLGDGAVRTVLKRLRDGGYADASASGSFLTQSGMAAYGGLRKKITPVVEISRSQLSPGKHQAALAVRKAGPGVRVGIELRDAAIRTGAAGATTYVIRSGKFAIPGGSGDCEREFPSPAWRVLRSDLHPREGDAVIVCGSDTRFGAILGALSAALALL